MGTSYLTKTHHDTLRQAADAFYRKYLWLVIIAWTVPAIFGLGFLVYIDIFSLSQLWGIVTTPLEPVFVAGTMIIALIFFKQYARPLVDWLQQPTKQKEQIVRRQLGRFPLLFWGMFLVYLVLAPAATILSAQIYTDYQAMPIDWFRVHLVALIVSIIVGLPVFFLLFDLFGTYFGKLLTRPLVTIKTRVFLIGALVPLLMDTMLVQYYWTKTGYFGLDTFTVWVMLELLAIAGSLLFLHSFGQSLNPLHAFLQQKSDEIVDTDAAPAPPASTDELGLLTNKLAELIENLYLQHIRLDVGNRMLHSGQTLDELDIHQLIVDLVSECFLKKPCWLLQPDKDGAGLRVTHVADLALLPEKISRIVLPNEIMLTETLHQRQAAWLLDDGQDDIFSAVANHYPDHDSILAAPLSAGDGIDGLLILFTRLPDSRSADRMLTRLDTIRQEITLVRENIEERRASQRIEKAIADITEVVSKYSSEQFFNALTEKLAHILRADGVGIGVLVGNEANVIETLAFRLDDEMQATVRFELAGTPCEHLSGQQSCVFGKDIQTLFPDIEMLHHTGMEAYVGISMCASGGPPLGLLFALFRRPMANTVFEESVMQIFAARAGLEIERQRSEAHISKLAYFDKLTGLPNRQLLFDRLQQAMARAQRHQLSVAVIMLDLDHFKAINDSLGHTVGDRLLTELAHRLERCIRTEDTVSRIGGDEFVLVLQGLAGPDPSMQVTRVISKIQKTLEPPYLIEGHELMATASLGITLYPDNGRTTEELLKHADTAMYKAKTLGRNGYQFFSSTMNTEAVERLRMENCLRQALEKDQFELVFQPKVSISNGIIVGAETLLRWHHPDQGDIPPDRFIPIAEETGLILPIGHRVMEMACQAAARFWCSQNDPDSPIRLSINVSPRQFHQPDFVSQLESILTTSGIHANCIELEITEHVLLEGIELIRKKLDQLMGLGITIAIDDFGTGYSSLSYLKQLPLNLVKIDGSFVDGLPDDVNDAAIVQAILAMTKHLGIRTVAECVETSDQLDFLRTHGCHDFQGYLFSPPVGADAFEKMLTEQANIGSTLSG